MPDKYNVGAVHLAVSCGDALFHEYEVAALQLIRKSVSIAYK